jgi:activator of 2-hydroxyglutaryl-CoA dehydratase
VSITLHLHFATGYTVVELLYLPLAGFQMARLTPNLNVLKMTGFALGFTYLGVLSVANYLGMTTKEVIKEYPIPFYFAMGVMITLFLQEEIREQKETRIKNKEQQQKEEDLKRKEEKKKQFTQQPKDKSKNKKRRRKKGRKGKK